MKKKPSSDIWIFLVLLFVFGSTGILPLLLIAGALFLIMHYAIKQSNANQNTVNTRTTQAYGYSERKQGNAHTASDLAKINVFLRNYFRTNGVLAMTGGLQLMVRTDKYNTLSNLDVYRNGSRLGTMNEFRTNYNELYDAVFDELLAKASTSYQNAGPTIIDAEVVDSPKQQVKPAAQETKAEVKKEAPKEEKASAISFINQINDLNANIPDEEITNGLYEMCSLLKQVSLLENKFPKSASKMHKMYEYYLPYMVKILSHYENVQTIRSDANYDKSVEQLKGTIKSINEALNNIIPTMSDSDFADLSADMTTLEALLKKDGLTGGMDMQQGGKQNE